MLCCWATSARVPGRIQPTSGLCPSFTCASLPCFPIPHPTQQPLRQATLCGSACRNCKHAVAANTRQLILLISVCLQRIRTLEGESAANSVRERPFIQKPKFRAPWKPLRWGVDQMGGEGSEGEGRGWEGSGWEGVGRGATAGEGCSRKGWDGTGWCERGQGWGVRFEADKSLHKHSHLNHQHARLPSMFQSAGRLQPLLHPPHSPCFLPPPFRYLFEPAILPHILVAFALYSTMLGGERCMFFCSMQHVSCRCCMCT